MTKPAEAALLVHVCSFYRTNKVHERLFERIHDRFGVEQVVIVPTKERGPELKRERTSFGEVIEVPCLDLATSLSSLVRGRRIVRHLEAGGVRETLSQRRVRLVHAHSAYMDGFAAERLARLLDTGFALSFRMTDTRFCFRYRWHASHFMKSMVQRAARLLVISHSDAIRVARRLDVPPETIGHLGSGLDDVYIDGARTDKPAGVPATPTFLTMGKRGGALKRVDLTVRACHAAAKRLNLDGITVRVLGMTRDDYAATYRRSPAPPGLDAAEFLGRVESREAILALMRESSAFVMPSRETFGIAYLEAISQCTPAVWLQRYGIDGEFPDDYVGVPTAGQNLADLTDAIVAVCTTNDGVLGPFERNPVARLGWSQLAERYGALLPMIDPATDTSAHGQMPDAQPYRTC